MCCTSIAPCWEQHAPWGNINIFSSAQECLQAFALSSPAGAQLLLPALPPSPKDPRFLLSSTHSPKVNSVPPAKCSSPSHRALPLPRRSSAPHPRESLAGHLMQHYACYRFLYFIELPLEIISFL